MNRVALVLGVAVLVSGALLCIQGRQLKKARESATLWEESAKSQSAVLEELRAVRETTEAALREREEELGRLSQARAVERMTFKEARRADKSVDDWSRVRLPDAVRGVCAPRAEPGGDLLKPPGAPAGADRSAGVSGRNQR